MTPFAERAEPAPMDIIGLVTRHTPRRDTDVGLHGLRVAALAAQAAVPAVEHEAGLGVVVEAPQAP